jgi:cytochrome c-type biogenesis protein CcmE
VKKSHIILLLLIAVCIGVFASKLGSVSSYSSYEDAKSKEGKTVQLIGTLTKDKPVNYNPQIDPNSFSFHLIDKEGQEFKVVCYDEMPRDFEKSDEIVLTGSMKGETFHAEDMLVKCPSKYVDEEVEKQ